MAVSPIDVQTMGMLDSPLSVQALGWLTLDVPEIEEEPTAAGGASPEDIQAYWAKMERRLKIRRNDDDFIRIVVQAVRFLLGRF